MTERPYLSKDITLSLMEGNLRMLEEGLKNGKEVHELFGIILSFRRARQNAKYYDVGLKEYDDKYRGLIRQFSQLMEELD